MKDKPGPPYDLMIKLIVHGVVTMDEWHRLDEWANAHDENRDFLDEISDPQKVAIYWQLHRTINLEGNWQTIRAKIARINSKKARNKSRRADELRR